jgi:uncharacterized RDD family membrane protein YckC
MMDEERPNGPPEVASGQATPATPPPGGPIVNWAPPPPPAEVPGAPGLSFGGTGTRFAAYIVDLVILGVVGFTLAALLGQGQTTVVSSPNGTFRSFYIGGSNPIVALIFGLLGAAYFTLAWSGGRRATVGQRLFHLQVGTAFDGRPLSTTQAFRRWIAMGMFVGLLAFIPVIGPLSGLVQLVWTLILAVSIANSPTKQGLHDRFANSAVVQPSAQKSDGFGLACMVIVGLFVVLAVIGLVVIYTLGPSFFEELSRVGRSI